MNHDFDGFLRGSILDILKHMKYYEDIFESYREASHVEYLLKRSGIRKSESPEEKKSLRK